MISEAVLKDVLDGQRDRLLQIAKARRAYEGKFDPPLQKTKADTLGRDNIMLNFAAPIVDMGVSFLLGRDIGFEIDGAPQEKMDDWMQKCWKQNHKMRLMHEAAQNGGITGDVFLRLTLPSSGKPYPRIINLDPSNVTPILGTEDIDDVLGWINQWNCMSDGRPAVRRQIFEPQGNFWTITDQISIGDETQWRLIGVARWPYPWSPIFHCNNLPEANVFFGISDIEKHVLSVNDAINMVMSNMARILRLHAHPKTWGRGFNSNQIDMSVDVLTVLQSPTAELRNLEMQSDLSSSLDMYLRLKEAFYEISGIPEIAVGKLDKIGQLSGVALKILYQRILQKNGTKQLYYGDLVGELNMRLLEMGGFGEDHIVECEWQDPLPEDKESEANQATVLNGLGVSKDTLLTELGYDPDAEAAKRAKEQDDATAMGSAILDKFDRGGMAGGDENE